jgi:mono/diheme cytochrome c family protein
MHSGVSIPVFLIALLITLGCGNPKEPTDVTGEAKVISSKGVGKFQSLPLSNTIDAGMVRDGEAIHKIKCASCHKLSADKLVGPGFLGLTKRRTPEYIMNFITNTDEMINKDEMGQALAEVFKVRMPNPQLKDDEARAVLEFLRNNDSASR